MDGLEFIAEMTRALAWPLVVGVLVFAFRAQIRERISFLRSVKAGPLEATLDAEVAGIQRAATAATDAPAVAQIAQRLASEQDKQLMDAVASDEEARRTEIEEIVRYAVRYGHMLGTIIPPGKRLPEIVTGWSNDGRFILDVDDSKISTRMIHPSRSQLWMYENYPDSE